MKCKCGKQMRKTYKNMHGSKTKISICDTCGKEFIDMEDAIKMQKRIMQKKP